MTNQKSVSALPSSKMYKARSLGRSRTQSTVLKLCNNIAPETVQHKVVRKALNVSEKWVGLAPIRGSNLAIVGKFESGNFG